ncbi:ribosome production factor 1-like [Corticium candelabrum]|uniref:ribosome production factor 1-like n=1 Tax=Corticium candelabrum TaxID=121492 RepID=UPI002E26E3DA|nr:ribosome production factor 1-like [Corticium candelabrum]
MADCVRNKQRRLRIYQREKAAKKKDKRKLREKRKREREELGDEAPPKQIPKTIENMRVPDETIVDPDDDEVLEDERTDEMAAYFDRKQIPKVLITTSYKCTLKTVQFLDELEEVIPNSEVRRRSRCDLKKVIEQAKEHEFTDVIVVNEDRKEPNALILCHLPDGPTAHFKLTNVKCGWEIKRHGRRTHHRPEVVMNHFSTRLGHTVGRMLAAIFPHDPEFKGRTVVTFHNQRDYIFFRHHRYIFKSAKKVGMQELGPRFTLKLRSVQQGTFDSKFGKFVWIHKRKEMDTSRRKFHL